MPLTKHWITEPPFWPWGAFFAHFFVLVVFVLSLYSVVVIQKNIIKKEQELLSLKVLAIDEERDFHSNMDKSMMARNQLLRLIANKVGVPSSDIDETLKKDPVYINKVYSDGRIRKPQSQ